eukprot:scaffold168914_cov32-Tisochrysis_lutea.AAC.1
MQPEWRSAEWSGIRRRATPSGARGRRRVAPIARPCALRLDASSKPSIRASGATDGDKRSCPLSRFPPSPLLLPSSFPTFLLFSRAPLPLQAAGARQSPLVASPLQILLEYSTLLSTLE